MNQFHKIYYDFQKYIEEIKYSVYEMKLLIENMINNIYHLKVLRKLHLAPLQNCNGAPAPLAPPSDGA